MTGGDLSPAVDMACEKEPVYFSTHSLGELLSEAGVASDALAVRSLTWRLIKDEEHGLVHAMAAGLREAISGDDEFVRMVSAAAGMVRYDLAAGPVVDALVSAGRPDPGAALLAAERLVEIGDADYAAFLIAGAYGGAAPRCDVLIESLESSGSPAGAAASLRSLRVAHTEHGTPDAGRIADAVDRAVRIDDDEVHREAMAALLDIRAADRNRAGRAIRDLAARRRACRPLLMGRILLDSNFDAAECIDLLDVCTDGVSADDRYLVYDAYRALKSLACDRPGDVARLLARLAGRGAYIDARAGPVLEELGRHHPRRAAEAVLSLLGRPPGPGLDGRLPSMIRHAARLSDPKEFAEPILEALDSEPDMSRHCLAALAALACESPPGGRGGAFAAGLLGRVRDYALRTGAAAAPQGAACAPSDDPAAECRSVIGALIAGAPHDEARAAAQS